MINKIREVVGKLIQRPQQVKETVIDSPESLAYSEMVVNNLESKYEGQLLSVPIQLINFDAILESLVNMGHPSVGAEVTKPYDPEDFSDFPEEIAELISDYLNVRLKILVNTVIQELMNTNQLKMSADEEGVKYYTEEPNEDIDGIIRLEKTFRAV